MKNDNYAFYKTDLEIDIENQFISVDMELNYCVLEEKTKKISFLLHENLNISNLAGTKIQSYESKKGLKTILPEAKTITIYLESDVAKGEKINIQLQYSGNLGVFKPYGENRLTPNWIALGLYFPWFPLNPKQLSAPSITYDINVKIDERYSVFGIGKTFKNNNIWNIRDNTPNLDMIVMASKDLRRKEIQMGKVKLEIYYNKTSDTIEKYGMPILDSFIKWFGKNEKENIKIVFAPGGNYARKGFIVLREPESISDKKDLIEYISFLSHEISHLWWTNAPVNTWEEWLNESFAEYSSLMIIREAFSRRDFDELLKQKIDECSNTPPIKDLDMDYKNRKLVTYDKGCIILNKLENRVGEMKFIEILKESYEKKINSTEEFLRILLKRVGQEVADEIEEMLTSY